MRREDDVGGRARVTRDEEKEKGKKERSVFI